MTDCSKHNKASSGAAIAGVSRSGQVSTASLSGTAVVLVTVHEEFGINQTAVVHVEVGMWKQSRSGHEKLAATRITLCKRSRFSLLCDAWRGKAAATTTEFCCCNRLHEVKLLWFHTIRFLTNISRFIRDKLSLRLFPRRVVAIVFGKQNKRRVFCFFPCYRDMTLQRVCPKL